MDFIKTYFAAEKSESLLFLLMGVAAISFSAFALLKWNESFYKGLAIPLIAIGLIQILVGGIVYFRTDKQIADAKKLYQTNLTEFKGQEIPRMEVVMKKFSLYKKIEIAFVVIGLLLIIIAPAKEFWLGIGVGMLLQGSVMLSLDIFAERRGKEYIQQISLKIQSSPD
jgi:hypothetical protein